MRRVLHSGQEQAQLRFFVFKGHFVFLRASPIPARSAPERRFRAYFNPEKFEDHWVCEH
jgi:hypothetical protein